MEAFGAHGCPKDAKMDPKDSPQTFKMRLKIDENLPWGPHSGQEGSPSSNLRSQGCPGGGYRAKIESKSNEKYRFFRVVSRVMGCHLQQTPKLNKTAMQKRIWPAAAVLAQPTGYP